MQRQQPVRLGGRWAVSYERTLGGRWTLSYERGTPLPRMRHIWLTGVTVLMCVFIESHGAEESVFTNVAHESSGVVAMIQSVYIQAARTRAQSYTHLCIRMCKYADLAGYKHTAEFSLDYLFEPDSLDSGERN